MKGNHPVHQAQVVPLGRVRGYRSPSFSLTASPKLLGLSVAPQTSRILGVTMPEIVPQQAEIVVAVG